MLEASDDLDLLQEPLGTECGRQLWMQDLESDLPVVLEVLCEEHHSHAATTYFTLNGVAIAKCSGETFQQVRHKSLLRERGVRSI